MLHRKGPREGRKNSDFFFLSVLFCSPGNIKQKQNFRNLGDGLVINGWAWAAKRQMANVNTSSLSSANAECYASFLGCADMNVELFPSFFFFFASENIVYRSHWHSIYCYYISPVVIRFRFYFSPISLSAEKERHGSSSSTMLNMYAKNTAECEGMWQGEGESGWGWDTEKDIWIYVTDVPSCLTGCILPHKRTTNRLKDTE